MCVVSVCLGEEKERMQTSHSNVVCGRGTEQSAAKYYLGATFSSRSEPGTPQLPAPAPSFLGIARASEMEPLFDRGRERQKKAHLLDCDREKESTGRVASVLLGLTALAVGIGDVLVVTGASTGHDWRLFGCFEVVGEVVVEVETVYEDVGTEEKGRDEECEKR